MKYMATNPSLKTEIKYLSDNQKVLIKVRLLSKERDWNLIPESKSIMSNKLFSLVIIKWLLLQVLMAHAKWLKQKVNNFQKQVR